MRVALPSSLPARMVGPLQTHWRRQNMVQLVVVKGDNECAIAERSKPQMLCLHLPPLVPTGMNCQPLGTNLPSSYTFDLPAWNSDSHDACQPPLRWWCTGEAITDCSVRRIRIIPNSKTSVYSFLSKGKGANSIKVPIKLKSLASLHLIAFATVNRTVITHN